MDFSTAILSILILGRLDMSSENSWPTDEGWIQGTEVLEDHPNWSKLPLEDCGMSMANRIIGGSEAAPGEYPWMVFLVSVFGEQYDVCGGAIITRYYVLSAAHCFYSPEEELTDKVAVVAGTLTPLVDRSGRDVQSRRARAVHVHPGYSKKLLSNDIALLLLERPFRFNWNIIPICLPTSNIVAEDLLNERAITAGWGDTENGTWSSKLLQLVQIIAPEEACSYIVDGSKKICTISGSGNSACYGDSGGPLMIKRMGEEGKQRFYVVGVLAYGVAKCGSWNVCTRVGGYIDFILDKIQQV